MKFVTKGLSMRGDLKRHLRTHNGEKSHICEICNKEFSQRGSLKKHLGTHTSMKFLQKILREIHPKYSSPDIYAGKADIYKICNKGFSEKCMLNNHVWTCTGEKPYVLKLRFK